MTLPVPSTKQHIGIVIKQIEHLFWNTWGAWLVVTAGFAEGVPRKGTLDCVGLE